MMGDKQRKLRKWFQRHKWHTADTPTGRGFWLSSPIENCAGLGEYGRDPKTNLPREFAWEHSLDIELDRFTYPSDIDWKSFGERAESLCKEIGLDYYIKDSLRAEMEKKRVNKWKTA